MLMDHTQLGRLVIRTTGEADVAVLGQGRLQGIHSISSIPGLAQPRPHGLFVGEVLVFLLFKENLIKHANHQTRQEAVQGIQSPPPKKTKKTSQYSGLERNWRHHIWDFPIVLHQSVNTSTHYGAGQLAF